MNSMATIFEIWPLRLLSPNEISFDVTPANLPMINKLSEEWINGCLSRLGLSTVVRDWHVEACRCNYYSYFPESDDWEDRWRVTWTIFVSVHRLDQPITSGLRSLPIAFDRHDPSWHFQDYENINEDRFVLLFAYHRKKNDIAQSDKFIKNLISKLAEAGIEDIHTTTFSYDDGWREIRVRFISRNFTENTVFFDEMLRHLKNRQFIVNWEQFW